eukprot:216881-Alexandrium_andersonii.AAC.1
MAPPRNLCDFCVHGFVEPRRVARWIASPAAPQMCLIPLGERLGNYDCYDAADADAATGTAAAVGFCIPVQCRTPCPCLPHPSPYKAVCSLPSPFKGRWQ